MLQCKSRAQGSAMRDGNVPQLSRQPQVRRDGLQRARGPPREPRRRVARNAAPPTRSMQSRQHCPRRNSA
eukprot:9422961-Pyramimonas_sp.AAC.1